MAPAKKMQLAMLAMLTVVLVGVVGFSTFENMTPLESLYMTIITLSTVGFREVQPLHTSGKVFVMVLIVFGVASATFAASTLGQVILEGQLRRLMGRRKMESKIKKLKNHFIIAGFGRVGRQVAEEYEARNVPFIIIEKNEDALNNLNTSGFNYIAGEATEDDNLVSAKIESAKVLVSTLPSEADNVYISLTARHMNPELHIIARADNPGGERKLKRAGADSVVSPHILGGMRMAMASLRPNVVDFMQMTSLGEEGLGVEEISVPERCRFGGKTLVESGIKAEYGVTVVGIKKPNQKMNINPPPDAVILEKDILVLVGSSDELERLTKEMSLNS
ncbi:MAG: potassium channel protein [candidate division Zixibacteria bacterium]|nr:potassium channel protein [candidate division Zixibacteria bacterium]